jgi:hypothetical protein
MKFPVKYTNGNYQVTIEKDGTKTRYTPDDVLIPRKPETIDLNISNYCTNNCPWCYLDASENGKHGDLNHPLFDTIPPYTELAVNYAKHPNLKNFLRRMRQKKVIVNMTINQIDFNRDWSFLMDWQAKGLFHGLGISINSHKLTPKLKYFENTVAHTIFGLTPYREYKWISKKFDKVLVLGYKHKGRGKCVTPKEQFDIRAIFDMFKVVSFDNLAISQSLDKKWFSDEDWGKYYMGEEGSVSYYIDSVDLQFYKSSLETDSRPINNKTVIEMFSEVKNGFK